jgi:hypothetical protein
MKNNSPLSVNAKAEKAEKFAGYKQKTHFFFGVNKNVVYLSPKIGQTKMILEAYL